MFHIKTFILELLMICALPFGVMSQTVDGRIIEESVEKTKEQSLDNITDESDTQLGDFIKFFSGKCMARVVSVPTSDYLQTFATEGREVKQFPLNLHIKEKQLLWKNLDDEEMNPPHLRFDFLNTNCMMMSILMIEQSLIDEQVDFSGVPDFMKDVNGVRIRHHSEHTPWSQFLYITLCGATADSRIEIEKPR